MFYIRFKNSYPVETSAEYPKGAEWAEGSFTNRTDGWISSRDLVSMADARCVALYLTSITGITYLPVDEGDGTWPRYRIVEAPVLGAKVSRSFNGDTYPCGEISKITKTWQVTTTDGAKFRRYKETGGWREAGGSFWMCSGHVYEQNQHF